MVDRLKMPELATVIRGSKNTVQTVKSQLTKPATCKEFIISNQYSLMLLAGSNSSISACALRQSGKLVGSDSLSRSNPCCNVLFGRSSK